MILKKILSEKDPGKGVIWIPADATLQESSALLCQHSIGALLVTQPGIEPIQYVGIITERDIIGSACTGEDFKSLKVENIMTRDLIVAKSDDDVEYVMQVMKLKHIRHIPVIEDSKIIGILSMRDFMHSMLKQQEIQIRHLSDFIGTYGNQVF